MAYVMEEGLPKQFCHVPVDPLEAAAMRLHSMGYEKVGLWGISKGAELALTAGSLLPGLVNAVIAVAPMNTVCQGFSKQKGVTLMPGSTWSFHGGEVPYTGFGLDRFPLAQVLSKSLKARELTMDDLYIPLVKNPAPAAIIRAERITGPILLISLKMDTMWPSEAAAEQIMKRLREHGSLFFCQHLNYDCGGHLFVPMEIRLARAFKGGRGKYRERSRNARMDSLAKRWNLFQNVKVVVKMFGELKENTVQHTLCMPLCGRMIAARKCPDLFSDRDAERIVRELGAGLSCLRRQMGNEANPWYCLDMENVIALREKHIPLGKHEKNIVCDLNDYSWFDKISFDPAKGIVFTAGELFYYFEKENVRHLLCAMAERFPGGMITFDAVNALGLEGVNAEVKLAGNNSTKSVFSLERPREELESRSPRITNVIEKDYADGCLKGGYRKTPVTRLFNWIMRAFHMGFMLHIEFRESQQITV